MEDDEGLADDELSLDADDCDEEGLLDEGLSLEDGVRLEDRLGLALLGESLELVAGDELEPEGAEGDDCELSDHEEPELAGLPLGLALLLLSFGIDPSLELVKSLFWMPQRTRFAKDLDQAA
ncbi:MAG: hypothetical protein JWP89_5682 [Schlesneria sp.]|nr:hypothetical protein [Schlesneria sp.]